MLRDPVCGKRIHRGRAHIHIEYEHVTYYLCCPLCQAEFEASPQKFGERVTSSGSGRGRRAR